MAYISEEVLRVLIEEPFCNLLGHGVSTAVADITCYVTWNATPAFKKAPKDYVLLATAEETKIPLLKRVLGDFGKEVYEIDFQAEKEALVAEFLEENGYESLEEAEENGEYVEEFFPYSFSFWGAVLEEEYGVKFAMVPKMEPAEFTPAQTMELQNMAEALGYYDPATADEELKEFRQIHWMEKIVDAFDKAANAMVQVMKGETLFNLDIHPGQFMMLGEHMVCVDPAVENGNL